MAFYSAPGYRFHPTDEELVNYYWRQKTSGSDQQVSKTAVLNHDIEPGELPPIPSGDQVWHFFRFLVKYPNSERVRRTTKTGYWKVTSKDRKVMTKTSKQEIAVKKFLGFYKGRAPNGVRTSWVMHEYHPTFSQPNQNWVICKIKRNADDMSVPEEGESSSHMSSNYTENQSQFQNISVEDDLQFQACLRSFREYDEMDYSLSATHPFQMQSSSSDSYGATFGYDLQLQAYLDSFLDFQIWIPVGYRFHPANHEIINHYLANKMYGQNFNDVVAEVDLCRYDPWELPEKSIIKDDDQVWYFFCRPDYNNSQKVKRATPSGNWKPTGKIQSIKDKGVKIGTKRTLAFCSKPKDPKTARNSWIIHEYQSETQKEVFFCKLKRKLDDQMDNSAVDVGEQNRVSPATINGMQADEELILPDSLLVGPEEFVYEVFNTLLNDYQPQSPMSAVYYQNGSDTVKEAAPNRSAVKQGFGMESEMGRRSAKATSAKQDMKIKSSESVGGLGNVPFIHMETPLLVNRPSPRSVYAVNILVALCVSIFIIGDVLAVY